MKQYKDELITYTHASLFSGIGGFDLAASWMGWNNAFHCEINPFCQKILKYHFPESESYEDITKTDFRKWKGKVDVLSGGFPCQPFSLAGQRKGAEDNRYTRTINSPNTNIEKEKIVKALDGLKTEQTQMENACFKAENKIVEPFKS